MVELVWDGKYKDGKKVSPVRIALPFQTVETVNESAQQRQLTLDLFAAGRQTDWRNRLIWGDKKYVLPSLLQEFAAKVNLIYIDPPFDTGADFSFQMEIEGESFTKEPSIIEQKAYRDTWGRGLDSYLQWFYETAVLLRELLAENGSLYVHVDYHVSFYVKAVLDEIFGADRFVNEIVWKRQTAKSDVGQGSQHMGRIHESIFLYTKGEDYTWNMQYTTYDQTYIDNFYRYSEKDGRRYRLSDITAPGKASKGNPHYEFLGITRYWRFSKQRMQEMYEQGKIVQTKPGTVPAQKRYLDEMPGVPLQDLWTDIQPVQSQAAEVTGYGTQKPETLLQRIIKVSSNEGDLVLDCFCGSGTTAAVAEKLGRRWITCDLGRFAIHTARKRLLSQPDVQPFVVQNLGKYERQAWQQAEFADNAQMLSVQMRYRNFILQLYSASPLEGYSWLHGVKAGRLVHVGSVDAPISMGEVRSIVNEFWKVSGKDSGTRSNGIDILGWDFAFDLNETAIKMAADANVKLSFKKIPREVLEKKAVEQGDIRFYELSALAVEHNLSGLDLNLTLKNFFVSDDDIPPEVQAAITNWSQWIDYWAVDWDYRDDTFHNQWQSYRTRKDPKISQTAGHHYEQPGHYTVVIKVIDILGNDTTKAIEIEVK